MFSAHFDSVLLSYDVYFKYLRVALSHPLQRGRRFNFFEEFRDNGLTV